jgi:hypothetical protein
MFATTTRCVGDVCTSSSHGTNPCDRPSMWWYFCQPLWFVHWYEL